MMLASGSESDISEELPALDAARVVRCRSFETRGVLYSAYDLASAKGYATLLELRNSVFSLRNFAGLRYLEELDFPDLVEADAGVDEGPFESTLLDAFLGITVVTDVDVEGGLDVDMGRVVGCVQADLCAQGSALLHRGNHCFHPIRHALNVGEVVDVGG